MVLSDAAGQFTVFEHHNAACWVHAERLINRFDAATEAMDEIKKRKLQVFWRIYRCLLKVQEKPISSGRKAQLLSAFVNLCRPTNKSDEFDAALKRLRKLEKNLFRCFERPDIPLHNNLAESDIRDYVKKRKISGSTRSLSGLAARDTFASLKKTAFKQQVAFWDFLGDRINNQGSIPNLANLIKAQP